MKRKLLHILTTLTIVIILIPLHAFGQDYSNYFSLRLGEYSPTGDLDDIGLDSGFNGELSFTTHFSKYYSFELGAGYFKTDGIFSDFTSGIGTDDERGQIIALPFFFTLKGHIPYKTVEFYGGVGVGMYFATIDVDILTPIGAAYFSDSDEVFGFHYLAGINLNITEKCFFGIEAKKIATDDFNFSNTGDWGYLLDFDADLAGYTISVQIGIRF